MSITKKEVEHVARLARLALTEEEKELYAAQLSSILGYIEKLSRLDTTHVPPTTHVLPVANIWREDRAEPSAPDTLGACDEIIRNAPEHEGRFFKVKKVID